MEKKPKQRDVRDIILSLFPNIDKEKFFEIIERPGQPSAFASTKTYFSSDSVVNTEDSCYTTMGRTGFSNAFKDKENAKLDQIFANKEDRYRRAVRKAVTTQHLPKLKKNDMPEFLKKNIKSIAAKLSVGNDINKIKISSFSKIDTIFVLAVTGSQDTEYAFEVLTKRFSNISDNHKSIFAYIPPTQEEDKNNNYRNKREIVFSQYINNMRNLDVDRFFFFNEEKNLKSYSHPIQQVDLLCNKHSVSYMLCGFNGLKGPKGDNKQLEKALAHLMKISKTPFIILKEPLYTKPETSLSGFNWLFVFDRINIKCFNSFKKFAPLVDFSRDKVTAFTLSPSSNPIDDIEVLMKKEFHNRGFTNFEYESQRYDSEPYILIKNKVNFGNNNYDFVVIYNNISSGEFNQIAIEKQSYTNHFIINNCSSNICITNGN